MATVLSARTSEDLAYDPALEKVNSEHGVEYARARFGKKLRREQHRIEDRHDFLSRMTVRTPFETAKWELRSAAIKDESGNALFEQNDCEIPVTVEPVGDQRCCLEVLLR